MRRGRRSLDPRQRSQRGPTDPSPPDTLAHLQSCPDNCRHGGGWCLEHCRRTGCHGWRSCRHSASCIAMMTSEGPRKQELSLGEQMDEGWLLRELLCCYTIHNITDNITFQYGYCSPSSFTKHKAFISTTNTH